MAHQPPPMQKPNISRIHQALQRQNIDTAPLYCELKLDPKVMETDNTSISMTKYLELLESAAKQHNKRFLGIEIAMDDRNDQLGLLTYMLRNASNFEQALELLHRYVMLVAPGTFTALRHEDNECILTYKIKDIPPNLCCQDVESTITQFVIMIQTALQDPSWQPNRIYFEHNAPSEKNLVNFPIKCELIFDHFFSGVCFSQELMALPNINFDSELLSLLEYQAQQSTKNLSISDSLIDQVQLLIGAKLGMTEVSADSIALELGMSRRTLNRRLSEQNTTFNTVRENVIYHIAKETLCNTSTSITELAQTLGYSDSSAFNRAFKRLAGKKPLEYRKAHQLS